MAVPCRATRHLPITLTPSLDPKTLRVSSPRRDRTGSGGLLSSALLALGLLGDEERQA